MGYLRDYVVTLDSDVGAGKCTTGGTHFRDGRPQTEDLQDWEVIGKATTNRAANVREEPLANATVVRQLGNGMELQILAEYRGREGRNMVRGRDGFRQDAWLCAGLRRVCDEA